MYAKRKLLLELVNDFNPFDDFKLKHNYPLSLEEQNFYMQNRFSVHLLNENKFKISPDRIQGFKIFDIDSQKTLQIKSTLFIENWIEDFKKINICKIFFYDGSGKIVRFLDLDIIYSGYKLECDYKNNNFLAPVFNFKIF